MFKTLFLFVLQFGILLIYGKQARIVFGSCNKPYLNQPLWKPIISRNPDLFIWSGDAVYLDRPNKNCISEIWKYITGKIDNINCASLQISIGYLSKSDMKKQYDIQRMNIDYAKLTRNTPIIGVWDDHDYATNELSGSCIN